MHGKSKILCIAGKNQCAIDCLSFLIKKYKGKIKILALPNKTDDGFDRWQKSFKKFAKKNKIQITTLNKLYKFKNLYLFSLEYEQLLDIEKFNSKKLFNFHFSLLPKYRGCHTNFFQLYNGEKKSGVTLHEIDKGIDTGPIIDFITFKIPINSTAFENYNRLLKKSVILFKRNINRIINDTYNSTKQNIKKGSYYNRKSVDYKKMIYFNKLRHSVSTHNKIRSLIFKPFQLPIYNGKKIIKSIYKKNKIKLLYL